MNNEEEEEKRSKRERERDVAVTIGANSARDAIRTDRNGAIG